VLEFSGVESAERAQIALDVLTTKLNSLSLDRSNVGAAESRLGTAIGVLAASFENTLGAESRIRDVDVASEVAELTRERILQESSVAALRLVNQSQEIILDLLAF
jgi:flagellin